MRLYRRTRDDQLNACSRSHFDAENGRIALALNRLADILDEGPSNNQVKAEVFYAEGIIRRDFLGQGLKARELFERVYALDPKHAFAVINATHLARSVEEMVRWAAIFLEVVPVNETRAHEFMKGRLNANNDGMPFDAFIHDWAVREAEDEAFGSACAHMEIFLALTSHLDQSAVQPDESKARRWRAHHLRLLDEQAARARAASWEAFPADERWSLRDAVDELDRAIALDPWDAEMWNFKGAWCRKLGRLDDALIALERSTELRPDGYAKPHINKALLLLDLGKVDEACCAAEKALRQAQAAGDRADEQLAAETVNRAKTPRRSPAIGGLRPLAERLLKGALILADKERGEHAAIKRDQEKIGVAPVGLHEWLEAQSEADPQVVLGFFNRARKLTSQPSLSYVPIVAELLSDFSPERAFSVIARMPRIQDYFPSPWAGMDKIAKVAYDRCLHAVLYVTAHSEGVCRRDAARLLCLLFLGAMDGPAIRAAYRQGVLEIVSAAPPPMNMLDAILREELARMNPILPHLIADQDVLSKDERGRGAHAYREHFLNS